MYPKPMNPEELEKAVIALIDDNVADYTPEQYANFLGNLIGDLQMREEAAQEESENEG